jgi:hypothetical protein
MGKISAAQPTHMKAVVLKDHDGTRQSLAAVDCSVPRLKWTEADTEASCFRLEYSKAGESIRPVGEAARIDSFWSSSR